MIATKISKTATPEESRVVFSSALSYYRWRSIEGCPRATGYDRIVCLQIDLMRWERKNFGLTKSYVSALGVIEEIGELEDAQDDEDEWADAIGDILIYACNLCSKNGLDFGTMLDVALRGKPAKMNGMLGKLGKLAHVTLKSDQGIRGYADREVARRDIGIVLYRVVSSVVCYALLCGRDAREILFNVAEEVMKREWWADPGLGVPVFGKDGIMEMIDDMVNYPGTDSEGHVIVIPNRFDPEELELKAAFAADNQKKANALLDDMIKGGPRYEVNDGKMTILSDDQLRVKLSASRRAMTDEQVQSFKPDGFCWKRGEGSVCILVERHDVPCGWELDDNDNGYRDSPLLKRAPYHMPICPAPAGVDNDHPECTC